MQYIVLVSGSRDWTRVSDVNRSLDILLADSERLGQDFVLVHGACPRGADAQADRWAMKVNFQRGGGTVTIMQFRAHWETEGRSAGFKRNARMVNFLLAEQRAEQASVRAVIFQKNESRGAGHTLDLCRRAGIEGVLLSDNTDSEV